MLAGSDPSVDDRDQPECATDDVQPAETDTEYPPVELVWYGAGWGWFRVEDVS